jgi:Mn-containing catalase
LTWDGRYVNEGGHVIRDLRANIAAEAGALNTYEQLIAITTDDGTRDALRHLATREVSHTHMFMEALRSLNALEADIPRTNRQVYRGNPPENVLRPVRAADDGSDGMQTTAWCTAGPSKRPTPEQAGKVSLLGSKSVRQTLSE